MMKPPIRLRNEKGQVAIFIALIFPVLFLFFAMIVNVGLLVHHKINLQNSVDLAAYYGAGKQAEMMNAIAHTNYQIRQSWKLLAWRYRAIGTAGDMRVHPYSKIAKQIITSPNLDFEGVPANLAGTTKDWYEAPAFCATYIPFQPSPSDRETMCKDQSAYSTIRLFKVPQVIASFTSISQTVADASRRALDAAQRRCELIGSVNYYVLGEFLVSFNRDQGERKQLINMLSRGLSKAEDDFYDIDGDLASIGIKKTLENNLTDANKASGSGLKISITNGLGLDGCNGNGRADTDPAKWLSEIQISPAFIYLDWKCNSQSLDQEPKLLSSEDESRPNFYLSGGIRDQILQIQPYLSPQSAPYNTSLGYEKNPWCMSYVGIKAETTPVIPFMPLSGVKLKAQAYAKPFGGKIGPWYMSIWPSGSDRSSSGTRIDPLTPIRLDEKGNLADYKDTTRAPNYSRFVGDKYGLKSNFVLGQWGKAIHNLSPTWNSAFPTGTNASEPNYNHWSHLADDIKVAGTGDLLAWDTVGNRAPGMRNLELAAILPDQFDLTYYSIEPNFYGNYYKKIANNYIPKAAPSFKYLVRPDLGVRLGNKDLEKFSIRDQYKALEKVSTTDFQSKEPKVDFDTHLMYVAKDVFQVLTSWVGKDLMDYSLNTDSFGKCLSKPIKSGADDEVPTSGDCVAGGRMGYSVKLVSSSYLNSSDLDLGGEGASTGKILNPPPEN